MHRRLAALLVALPLAASFASSAQADPILTGCYGASFVVCDPSVSLPVEMGGFSVPVCAGTCTYVFVPTVNTNNDPVCVEYTNERGTPGFPGCKEPSVIARAIACLAQEEYCD